MVQPFLADVAITLLRVFGGLSMSLAHGRGKTPPSAGFIDAVAGMGLPAPELMAWAASLAELVGGILLAAGLLTRPAALAVAMTMGVAAFVHHASDPFQQRELALFYGLISLIFLVIGSGRLSLDRFLR